MSSKSRFGGPKARTCFICGRQTLIHGFDYHVEQCRDLFIKRESLKPPKERRSCPVDPMIMQQQYLGSSTSKLTHRELDELNIASQKSWSETLIKCKNCDRSFLPDKIGIHNKSCTSSNPARRIDESVKRGVISSVYDNLPLQSSRMSSSSKYDYNDDDDAYYDNGNMMTCKDCGRHFNSSSFAKHAKACKKVFGMKRKPFDSAKHRAQGTDIALYNKQHQRTSNNTSKITTGSKMQNYNSAISNPNNKQRVSEFSGNNSKQSQNSLPKWKADSLSFRQAMRAARAVTQAEKKSKATGIPLHILLPPSSSGRGRSEYDDNGSGYYEPTIDPSYIQCPTCGRSFNQKAGERHIPQCKNIINKPSRLSRGAGVPSYSTVSNSNRNSFGGNTSYDNFGSRNSNNQQYLQSTVKQTNNSSGYKIATSNDSSGFSSAIGVKNDNYSYPKNINNGMNSTNNYNNNATNRPMSGNNRSNSANRIPRRPSFGSTDSYEQRPNMMNGYNSNINNSINNKQIGYNNNAKVTSLSGYYQGSNQKSLAPSKTVIGSESMNGFDGNSNSNVRSRSSPRTSTGNSSTRVISNGNNNIINNNSISRTVNYNTKGW
eukprot:gene7238-9869_t